MVTVDNMTSLLFLAILWLQAALTLGQQIMSREPCPSGNFQSCFVSPCSGKVCNAYPQAECRNNYCDGCNVEFWVGDMDVTLNCDSPNPPALESQIAFGEECNGPVPQCFTNACAMATCPQNPSAECRTSKCDCRATFWSGGVDVSSTCTGTSGRTSQVAFGEECNGPVAQCFTNSCDRATCPQNPSAECRMSKCDCRAVFWSGNVDVTSTCNTGIQKPTSQIALGEECNGRMAQCLINPCISATCPQNPSAECRMSKCDCSATFWSGGQDITGSCSQAAASPTRVAAVQEQCTNNCFYPPCLMSQCAAFPQAECRNEYCRGCTARFYVGGTEVTDRCQISAAFSANNRLGLMSGLGGGWGFQ